jgi:hypothetical protein
MASGRGGANFSERKQHAWLMIKNYVHKEHLCLLSMFFGKKIEKQISKGGVRLVLFVTYLHLA